MDYYRELDDDMEFVPLIPSVVYERKANLVLVPGNELEGCAARQSTAYPMGPPPSKKPSKPEQKITKGAEAKMVSPNSIQPCKFRYTYVWLTNGREFWVWPTYIDRYTLAGFRWVGRGWAYFGIDLKKIDEFVCY